MQLNKVICQDCLEGLKNLESNSVNLVITSPPYAEQRSNVYISISEKDYPEWFTTIAKEISRVIKPDGSFFLNIKEHSVNGFRSTYVLKTVLKIVEDTDLNLVDTLIWQRNAFPGRITNKFKNAFEPIYHFAKQPHIKIRPDAVTTPLSSSTTTRLKYKQSEFSENNSGFKMPNLENFKNKDFSYPSNVIYVPNAVNAFSKNRWHPAVYPYKLIEFFIKAYSDKGDLVLDPFAGSATTLVVARDLERYFLGFEIEKKFCEKIKETFNIEVEYA